MTFHAALQAAAESGSLDWLTGLADASPIVLILTFVALLLTKRLLLPRELEVSEAAKLAAEARADRYEQMVLRLLTTAERVTVIADRESP